MSDPHAPEPGAVSAAKNLEKKIEHKEIEKIKAEKPEIKETKHEKVEAKEHKDLKHEKIEKNESKEHKDAKHEKVEKPEVKEHKDAKLEKTEKNEAKEHKDSKHEKLEKIEHKEHLKGEIGEKPQGKEKDGKEIFEGPPGNPGDPFPVEQQIGGAVQNAGAAHFISAEQRPDLSRGALSAEPDAPAKPPASAKPSSGRGARPH